MFFGAWAGLHVLSPGTRPHCGKRVRFLADTCRFCGKAITTIAKVGFGDDEDRARYILGRTYEYFLTRFAAGETTVDSEFYTPAR